MLADASATPAATGTPAATPTAVITPVATSAESASAPPSEMPSVSPAPPAAQCTGSADNQAFLTDAARLMSFDVYCAALPAKWYLAGGTFTRPNGGQVLITYKKTGGGQLEICEGQCPSEGTSGSASFGDLPGGLAASPGVNAIYASVGIGSATATYSITATGIAQSELASIGSTMIKVRKT